MPTPPQVQRATPTSRTSQDRRDVDAAGLADKSRGKLMSAAKRGGGAKKPFRRRRGAVNRRQAEQLIILLEEAAEIVQVSAKILRFGLLSHSPFDPNRTPNSSLLENEIGDLEGVVENLKAAGIGITTLGIRRARDRKRRRMQRWLMA